MYYESVMVNNSININKINSHLSSKPLLKKKRITTYVARNPCPGLGQVQKCDGVKLVNGIPTLSLVITEWF